MRRSGDDGGLVSFGIDPQRELAGEMLAWFGATTCAGVKKNT